MPTRGLVTRYQDDLKLFPDLWHKVGLVLGALFLLFFPFYASSMWLTVGNLTLVAVVGSVALMILTGFAGQISLGHAAFLALGGYTLAILGERYHLPFWLIMPVSGLVAAGVGLAIGVFALRLKGLYLAIVTIGLLYLVHHLLNTFPNLTHGGSGISVAIYLWPGQSQESMMEIKEKMAYGPFILDFRQKLYFIFLVIAVVVAWFAKNLHRSNAGRAMMAVRDHDIAAATLGVNPAKAKILAFGISSFVAGVAGAMYAMQQQHITAEPFDLDMSVTYIAMIVLGGIGSVFGAVAGAIAITAFAPLAAKLGPSLPFIKELSSSMQETVLFSMLVIVFLILEPLGLFGIWLRIKRYFMAWPFRY
jgi:branched-chain amino acid transport system permease protein